MKKTILLNLAVLVALSVADAAVRRGAGGDLLPLAGGAAACSLRAVPGRDVEAGHPELTRHAGQRGHQPSANQQIVVEYRLIEAPFGAGSPKGVFGCASFS